MTHYIKIVGLLLFLAAPTVQAGLVRLDFSGDIVAALPDDGSDQSGSFGGYFIMDPLVPDVRPETDNALYDQGVIDGSVTLQGVEYAYAPGPINGVFVVNDSPIANDLLAILTSLVDNDGNSLLLSLQFGDRSQSVFTSDAFPSVFDFSQFDEIDLNNANSSGAYFFPFPGQSLQGAVTFAELSVLPEPATIWLVAFIGFVGLRRSRKGNGW